MKLTYPICCGADVHKTFLVANNHYQRVCYAALAALLSTFCGLFIVCEGSGWGCNCEIAVVQCFIEFFIAHIPGGLHYLAYSL